MHVYHFRRLPGGRNNPDILTFYGRAKDGGFYPAGAYLLTNQGEFFAMTASVYLHGKLRANPSPATNSGRSNRSTTASSPGCSARSEPKPLRATVANSRHPDIRGNDR